MFAPCLLVVSTFSYIFGKTITCTLSWQRSQTMLIDCWCCQNDSLGLRIWLSGVLEWLSLDILYRALDGNHYIAPDEQVSPIHISA